MRKHERTRKALSILLCVLMLVQYVPTTAFAVGSDNLCEHHIEHTAECGYAEAVAGSDCTHVHSESCYALLSCVHEQEEHECTVESGCITMELDCHHTHGDCGYAEAVAPQECTTCQSILTHAENCGYVAPVAEVTCACVPGEDGTLVHTEGCGYVAPVAEVKCACQPTVTHGGEGCTYVEGKAGSPCTHTHAVKVDSADSCYKLLCSHADGGHDDACGYVAAVEAHECHYECAECANSDVIANQSADWCGNPLCSQEDAFHVTSCAQYVAPENPQCFCVEKCTEANVWCDVCGFDYSKCTGTDTAAAYADGDDLAISGAWMSSNTPYLASGSKEASATKPETGGYAYWDAANNTLTLNNFTSATGAATGIFYRGSAEILRIELMGNNSVTGGTGQSTVVKSGVGVNSDTDIIFSGGGTLTATGTGTGTGNGGGYGVFAWGDITVDSGTTLIATGSSFLSGVHAEGGSITVNGGSLTGNGGESDGNGVHAGTGITVNGGSLTGNSKVSSGVYADSISVSGDSHILATGGDGNYISVGTLDGEYYSYSGDGTDKTFAHSTDAPLTGTVYQRYFELVTAQHLSDTYTSNGDATHSRYCSCALHTKVTAPEACSGGTATCTDKAVCGVCRGSYGELAPTNHASTEFTYAANEDGTTHKKMHKCCNAVAAEAENHTGGTATCKDKAVCTVCGESYGELDANNHTPGENADYTDNGNGEHSYTCTVCGTTVTEAHTYVDGTCVCDAVKTYTVTLDAVGAKIVEINGEAVEISDGETFTVPHGQELKVKVENTLSQKETGVSCDAWDADWSFIDFDYDEATNTMTISANQVNRDIFIGATPYVSVQFDLHGGALTDEWKENLEEGFGYTWNAETSTLKAQYGFDSGGWLSAYFQLEGHTFAGAKVDGSDEVVQSLIITGDMTVDILWKCDGTATLTPVPAKDATCMEAGNIAHYVCTCGKLYEDEAGTKELTDAEVKTAIDPTNHVGVDTATGKCACDYQFGFYVERDIEIDGLYHETYWFDNLSDALSYAHGSTDYGQYTTQSATVRLHRDLTIEEGEIFSFQKQVVLDTNSFSVTNSGTLALEGYTYSTIPAAITGGTVTIGDKTYLWSSENEKWICAEGSHTEGTAATCVAQAICAICGESYGDLAAHTPDANGKCTVENCGYQYAAKIGDSFYETIHKALRAAEGINGCTLTLLDNITLTSSSRTASYVNKGTITLDLNGKTFSSNKGTLSVLGTVDLTIRDSIGGGKIVSTYSNAIYQTGGKLTIESGTFEGTLDGVFLSYDSTLIVKGGTFTGGRAMITGFGSDCEIDLTAIDPAGFTLKNNGSGTFAPTLPSGYAMVNGSGTVVTSLSAEESATVKASLENATVTLDKDTFTYDGQEHKPTVTVVLGDKPLTLGVDYTVIYAQAMAVQDGKPFKWFGTGPSESECINAGPLYFAVVEGIGNYYTEDTVTLCENFVIEPRPLTVKADDQTILVGGQINEESVTVTEGSLVAGHTLTASIQLGQYTEAGSVVNQPGFHEDVLTILKLSCDIMDGEEYVTDNYSISLVSGNLTVVEHVHEWSYSADGATITAECKGTIGTCPIGKQTVTVKAEGKTYDGTPVTAELDGSIDGVTAPEITYTGNTSLGTHTAKITLGEGENAATASVEFTITIPEAILSPATPDGDNDWYTSASLLAPNGYAISTIQDGTFGASLDLEDGTCESFTYWLTYEENQDCEPVSLTWTGNIKIDGSAPTVSGAAASVTDSTASITVSAEDDRSGVASTALACEDTSVTIGALTDGAFPVSGMQPNTSYTFTLTVKDAAGNEASATVKLTTEKGASSVTKAPAANRLTYTGTAQALVTAGEAKGGTMQYSLDNQNWSADIPTGTNADTYTVYYKVVGDANHNDTDVKPVEVTIAKADPDIGTVSYSGATLYDSTSISTVVLSRSEEAIPGRLELTDTKLTAGEGTYNWKFTPEDTDNYNTITGTVVLNVTADVLEKIEASGTLEKDSYSYGDTFSIDGLTVTATYTTGATEDVTELVSFDSTLAVGQTSVELTYQGKTCTVTGFTVARKQLDVSSMAWDVPENAVYSGTAYTATLTGDLPEGVTIIKTGDTATNAGSYTAKAVFSLAEGYSADNYEIVNGEDLTAEWSIDKADLTVTAVSPNYIRYGDDAPAYTASYSGFVNGETEAVLDGELVLSCEYDTADAKKRKPGDYPIVPSGLTSNNYEISYVNGNLEVIAANLVIVIDNKTVTYGDAAPEYTYHYEGFVYGEDISVMDKPGTVVCDYKPGDPVGTMEIYSDNYGEDDCYHVVNQDRATLTIEKLAVAEPTVTGTYTYTGSEQTVTLTDVESCMTIASGNKGTNAGSYEVVITLDGNHKWADGSDGKVQWSIAKAEPKAEDFVFQAPGNLTYDGEAKSASISVKTGIEGMGEIFAVMYYNAESRVARQPVSAGNYFVQINVAEGDNYTEKIFWGGDNWVFTIGKAKAEITVDTTPITVTYGETVTLPAATANFGNVSCDKTADDLVNAGTYTVTYTVAGTANYDGDTKTVTVTVNPKAITEADVKLNGSLTYTGEQQTQGITVTEGIDYEVSGNTAANVGTYTLTVTASGNYTGTATKQWSIKEAAAVVGIAPAANDLTYTGKDQALVTAGTTTDGTMMYRLGENGDYTNSIPTGNAAGEYIVWYYVKGDANHADSVPASVSVRIKKAAADYEDPTANTLTYNGNAQALVTEGTTADGTMMYKLGENGTYSATVPSAKDADTYTVYYYVKGDSNHEDSAEQKIDVTIGQLDITGKTVNITLADTLVYNGAEQTMGVSTVKLNDLTVTYTVSGNTGINATDYTLTIIGNGNFKGTATKEWSIAKKSVTVTAKDQSITYGETISATEITATGLVDGHSATVTLTPSTTNVTVSGTITASAAVITADGTDVTGNYNVSNTSGKLVINPDTSKIDALTTDNVTSADEEDIKAVQAMMASAETDGVDEATAAEWAEITATCEDLIDKIEAVETENARIADAVSEFDLATVKSSDETAISQLISDIDDQLATNNLTDEERSELEGLKTKCNNLIAKIDGTETLIGQLDKTVDDLDAETVKSTDKDTLEQVIEDAQTLIDSGNVTEAEKEALVKTQEDAEALIKVIDDTAAENKELTDQAASFDEDTVKSTDKENLEQLAEDIEDLLDTDNLTEDEREALKTVLEQVEGMIDTIEDTAEDSKAATDAIDALDPATVTSDDKGDLEQAIETIDKLLTADHLTEDERKALEDAKADAEALIDVIEAAQEATDTENTEKVEDVTADNVKPEDKEALEDAKADLEKALEDNAGNYTEEEKQAIQDEIQRIDDAIEALENVEDVTDAITQLPETVEPDDEEAAEKILDAKEAYDELTDHEKSLVDEDTKKKLDDLIASLTAYDIIKGDGGKWTKGSSYGLTFTANGPFSKFVGIEVDGKEVDEQYYDAKAGSTIITLKQSYLKRLSTGEHTITVLYTDGETSGTFKILAASSTPATGDDSNIMLWSGVLGVSTLGLVVLLADRKRRRSAK